MQFIEKIKQRAKKDIKTIILPEPEDKRVLEATNEIIKQGFANIILIGNKKQIEEDAKKYDINISGAKIVDILADNKKEEYSERLYELRKNKGLTIEQARKMVEDPIYYGVMMLKDENEKADGLVSGAIHSTADTLRPALQILKTKQGTKLVSAFFVMDIPDCTYGENGVFVFGDCGLNSNPTSEELSEIAISSAKSFENLIEQKPKVAMLSYSTHGSAKSELTEKVIKATELVKQKQNDLLIDGELQLDAAIIPEIAKIKAPNSQIKGKANVLIFPDLNSGNIGYKLVQRFAKAEAYGPLCQGISMPVNDLSRGCTSTDIVGVVAITAVQAQNNIL